MAQPTWHKAFLAALRETGGNVSAACEAANVKRRTAYDSRASNAEFSRQWDAVMEAATDDLEQEARRRAFEGTRKGVWHNGELVGHELVYSDTLTIFLLKGHRPERFRDNYTLKHEGTVGVEHTIHKPTPVEMAEILAIRESTGDIEGDNEEGQDG